MVRPETDRRQFLFAALTVYGLAAVARLLINFVPYLPPGIDAGYYPVQSRAIIESGTLLYHDLPLTFYLHAGIARIYMLFGASLDSSVLLASQLVDSLLPPVAAVFVMLLVRAWSPKNSSWGFAAMAAGFVAVLSLPSIRMVSDFEKNSIGLVWLAGAVWGAWVALDGRRWGWLVCMLGVVLAGLTHVGAAGATVLSVGCILVVRLISADGRTRRAGILGLLGLGAAAALAIGAMWLVDANRAWSLLRAPVLVFRDPAIMMVLNRMGNRGGMGMVDPFGIAAIAILWVIGIATLILTWRDRTRMSAAARATAAGCALAAMALTCPLIGREYLSRLAIMACVPGAVPVAYLLVRRLHRVETSAPALHWPVLATAVLALASTIGVMPMVARSPLTRDGVEDLLALKARLDPSKKTLVLTRHGVEFWVRYYLRGSSTFRLPDDPSVYDQVLVLEEKNGPRFGPQSGPRMGPSGQGSFGPPRGQRENQRPPRDFAGNPGQRFDGPPAGRMNPDAMGGPGSMGPQQDRRGSGVRGEGGGPMPFMAARAPAGSKVLLEGTDLRVLEVREEQWPELASNAGRRSGAMMP